MICFPQRLELVLACSPYFAAGTKRADAFSFLNQLPLHAMASFEHEELADMEGVNRLTVFNCNLKFSKNES